MGSGTNRRGGGGRWLMLPVVVLAAGWLGGCGGYYQPEPVVIDASERPAEYPGYAGEDTAMSPRVYAGQPRGSEGVGGPAGQSVQGQHGPGGQYVQEPYGQVGQYGQNPPLMAPGAVSDVLGQGQGQGGGEAAVAYRPETDAGGLGAGAWPGLGPEPAAAGTAVGAQEYAGAAETRPRESGPVQGELPQVRQVRIEPLDEPAVGEVGGFSQSGGSWRPGDAPPVESWPGRGQAGQVGPAVYAGGASASPLARVAQGGGFSTQEIGPGGAIGQVAAPVAVQEGVGPAARVEATEMASPDGALRLMERLARERGDMEAALGLYHIYMARGEVEKARAILPGKPEEATEVLERLERLRREVGERAELVIRTVKICSKVEGFGRYEEVPAAELASGREQQVFVYVELENFAVEQSPDGRFAADLHADITVYDKDYAAVTKLSADVPDLPSERPRRDFFLRGVVNLPVLAAGRYQLTVQVEDKVAGKLARPGHVYFEVSQ